MKLNLVLLMVQINKHKNVHFIILTFIYILSKFTKF